MRQVRMGILLVCAGAMIGCILSRAWASDSLVGIGPMGAQTCLGTCKPEAGALIVSSVATLGYLAIAGAVAAAIGCVVGAVKHAKRLNALILVVAGLVSFLAFEFAIKNSYAHLGFGAPFFVAVLAAVIGATALLVQPRDQVRRGS